VLRTSKLKDDMKASLNEVADRVTKMIISSSKIDFSLKYEIHELLKNVIEVTSNFEELTSFLQIDSSKSSVVTAAEYEKEFQNLRSVIAKLEKQSKIDTEALVKYQIKCLEYDSILEEREVLKEELQEAYQKISEVVHQREETSEMKMKVEIKVHHFCLISKII